MDPRERADAALARARARGSFVVTPEDAISPMDALSTLQIPRSLIVAAMRQDEDPDATMVVPMALTGGFGDDRTRSMPSPVPPQAQRPAEPAAYESYEPYDSYDHYGTSYADYEDDNPITHSPRTQPLHLQQQHMRPPAPPQPVHEEQDGIIPTTTTVTRRTLAQRLDGE